MVASLKKLLVLIIVLGIAASLAMAGNQWSISYQGVSAFALCGLLAFIIQWLSFVPAYIFQTERYYDLMGSIAFIFSISLAFYLAKPLSTEKIILGSLVLIWTLRLGSFLFIRILQDGSDSRFDEIKPDVLRFFNTWNLQALWVFVTASPALIVITSTQPFQLTWLAYFGGALWLLGMVIEVIADQQKRLFRKQNKGLGFIQTGLWKYSRHPNYFGEILLWIGITLVALPSLQGAQFAVLLSPCLVIVLLTKVSGIPMLEAKSDKKWQGNDDYQKYKATTPKLIPRLKF